MSNRTHLVDVLCAGLSHCIVGCLNLDYDVHCKVLQVILVELHMHTTIAR